MIKYQENAKPAIINYNVPEPTSYRGRNLIKIEFGSKYLKNLPGEKINTEASKSEERLIRIPDFMKTEYLPLKREVDTIEEKILPLSVKPETQLNGKNKVLNFTGVVGSKINENKVSVITSGINGTLKERFGKNPESVEPALYIVETYKLSNFLGDYGAGKVINTFSLLPGEKTKISIKSYKNSSLKSTLSSSIFDSYKAETEESFETSVQSENSDKNLEEETFNYHVEAEAEAKWGWGSAKVSGGLSGSSNSTREIFAKNLESSTNKHANKASAQRDITINSTSESNISEGEEEAIERIIENINTDRTLNFVFRQMNQEFISVLHLVDVKIGYYNGYKETKREVSINDLDNLLEEVLLEPNKTKKLVFEEIVKSLSNIIDYEGKIQDDFITKNQKFGFYHVNRNKRSKINGTDKDVEGIVIMQTSNVLRTDGVIVESLIGQSDSHSPFTSVEKEKNLLIKDESIKSLGLKNELMDLFIKSLKDNDEKVSAKILEYFNITSSSDEN